MDEIQIEFYPPETLKLSPIETDGLILDIGGGGEGVIGKLCGRRVVSIDLDRQELEEVQNDALKLVMDAGNLKFLDGSFEAAAAFFSLMFLEEDRLGDVFAEVYRVLKPGGVFYIWDLAMEGAEAGEPPIVCVPLDIELPFERLHADYGCARRTQSAASLAALARAAGFAAVEDESRGRMIVMRAAGRGTQ
ncbi:MAG: class I SAM-dependent methyltransferase [Firmicutes bacterium]|nr:class I SAM-dependent methyltransferase [Bacillota bacterium]